MAPEPDSARLTAKTKHKKFSEGPRGRKAAKNLADPAPVSTASSQIRRSARYRRCPNVQRRDIGFRYARTKTRPIARLMTLFKRLDVLKEDPGEKPVHGMLRVKRMATVGKRYRSVERCNEWPLWADPAGPIVLRLRSKVFNVMVSLGSKQTTPC